MRALSTYPVICTTKVAESAEFYATHFGYEPIYVIDWYISMHLPGPPRHELALLDATHPSLPEAYRREARGILLNLEVEDVDAEYERIVVKGGLTPVLTLRSEPFGQRHFIVADPNDLLIDVITQIPFAPEYAAGVVT